MANCPVCGKDVSLVGLAHLCVTPPVTGGGSVTGNVTPPVTKPVTVTESVTRGPCSFAEPCSAYLGLLGDRDELQREVERLRKELDVVRIADEAKVAGHGQRGAKPAMSGAERVRRHRARRKGGHG